MKIFSIGQWVTAVFSLLAITVLYGGELAGLRLMNTQLSDSRIETLRQSTAYLMSLSDEEVFEMIPKQSQGIYWTACPNCSVRSRRAHWLWDPRSPRQIQCADCEMVFPNDKYPDDAYIEVEAPDGVHRYHYYSNPETSAPLRVPAMGQAKERHFLRAAADWQAKEYLCEQARDIGLLYYATGDENYAARAFLILGGFASVFPGYPYIYEGNYAQRPTLFLPYHQSRFDDEVFAREFRLEALWRPSSWSWWAYMDVSLELLTALEAISDWPWLQTEEGQEELEWIATDLFGRQIDHVLSFNEHHHNMSVSHKWPSLLLAAQVLRDPDLFHLSFYEFEEFLRSRFLYDGSWMEASPSYTHMTMGGLRKIRDVVAGYSDPPGYRNPQTDRRFDDLDFSQMHPHFDVLENLLLETRFPDGRMLPINDTWPTRSYGGERDSMETILYPGFGIAILGGGRGDYQFHSYLSYTSGASHQSYDALSIGLFAHGEELFSSRGYTHTRYRTWTRSTMSHNTVVVDGRQGEWDRSFTGNRLRYFADDGEFFRLVAARSDSIYRNRTGRYERMLVAVGRDARDMYLIDVFDVVGGQRHDYLLHGSADVDSKLTVSPIKRYPGELSLLNSGARFIPPIGERSDTGGPESYYGFVNSITGGEATGEQTIVLMQLEEVAEKGTRSLLLTETGDQLLMGEAPSVRRAGGRHHHEDESLLDRDQVPLFCWQRKGANLSSRFIALHQALPVDNAVTSVTKEEPADGIFILRIERAQDGVDYFVRSDDPNKETLRDTPHGRLSFRGHYGWIRLCDSGVEAAVMAGDGFLELGDFRLTGKGDYTGRVTAFMSNGSGTYFDIDQKISTESEYDIIIIIFPDNTERAYSILWIDGRNDEGQRILVKESSGFEIGGSSIEITSFPQRSIKGTELQFRLIGLSRKP